VYLHTDHLGSVSVATVTDASGQVLSGQEYDPWGKVRTGGIGETTLNYTGQRVDSTGLLYYHARYYDPSLARFISPDMMVQGSSPLKVGYHEIAVASLKRNQEGPLNSQALNRYAYTLNNPHKYTDPGGHITKSSYTPLGANGDVGDYRVMIGIMYNKIRGALNSLAFSEIKNGNLGDVKDPAAAWKWTERVSTNGEWDLKKDYREFYGTGNKSIFFSAGGKQDVSYSIFGNILFGYLGYGVGFSRESLMNQARTFDFLTDPKGVNQPDLMAVEFGILLWEKYGPNITQEQLESEIAEYIRTHDVHTRQSIANCQYFGPGLKRPVQAPWDNTCYHYSNMDY
jgi:RHS repeat-associated protein